MNNSAPTYFASISSLGANVQPNIGFLNIQSRTFKKADPGDKSIIAKVSPSPRISWLSAALARLDLPFYPVYSTPA